MSESAKLGGAPGPEAADDLVFATRSDLPVGDGPQRVFVSEVAASYRWSPGDTTAPNGWTLIAPNPEAPGRWRLSSRELWLPAKEKKGEDDWGNYRAAVAAVASIGATLRLRPTTYRYIDAVPGDPANTPSGAKVRGVAGLTRIVSSIADSGFGAGGFARSVFYANASSPPGAVDVYLSADTVIGSNLISVTSPLPVGTTVAIYESALNNAAQQARVVAVSKSAPWVLTLDEPLHYLFTVARSATVSSVIVPSGIEISDLIISGTGDRAIELALTRDSLIHNVAVVPDDGTFTAFGMSFDVGSFRCTVENSIVIGGNRSPKSDRLHFGIALESNVKSRIVNSHVQDVGNGDADTGFYIASSREIEIVDSDSQRCNIGLDVNSSAGILGTDHSGVAGLLIRRSQFERSKAEGIRILDGTSDIRLFGVSANHNGASGIFLGMVQQAPTTVAMEDVEASNNSVSGFRLMGGHDISMANVRTKANGAYGIDSVGGELTVLGLTATDDAFGAIRTNGGTLSLSQFTITATTDIPTYWKGLSVNGNETVHLQHGLFSLVDLGVKQAIISESGSSGGHLYLEDIQGIGKALAGVSIGGFGDDTLLTVGSSVDFRLYTYPFSVVGGASYAE